MCYEAEHYIILGEILSAEGIRPSDDRISVINNMMKPQNREEVQRLLGIVNYVGKYIAICQIGQNILELYCVKILIGIGAMSMKMSGKI